MMDQVLMVPMSTRLALAAALIVARAHAQPPPTEALEPPEALSPKATPSTPTGDLVELSKRPEAELLVRVQLTGNDPLARYEIRSTVSDAVLLTCPGACDFRIWPGRYRLLTLDPSHRIRGEEPILIDRDSRVQVKSPGKVEPLIGGLLTAVGTLAVIAGAAVYQSNACEGSCSDQAARNNRLGFGLVLSGVATIPVGILLLRHGTRTEVTVTLADFSDPSAPGIETRRTARGLSWSVAF